MRVLYLASGNLAATQAGMDVVARVHLQELLQARGLQLKGIFVAPGKLGQGKASVDSPWENVQGFTGDLAQCTSPHRGLALKLRNVLLGGAFGNSAYISKAAQQALSRALASRPEVIILDHFTALANLGLWRLASLVLVGRTKLLYLAHDVTPKSYLDSVKLKDHPVAKLWGLTQMLQVWWMEVALCRISSKVIFISEYDRYWYRRWIGRNALSLCPALPSDFSALTLNKPEINGAYLVFVGSPSFAPNAFALHWLTKHFASALLTHAPELKIVLVGKGTEHLGETHNPNVVGLGFVDGPALVGLLQHSTGLFCPVIHGSGLKVKVLEALAAGVPVFATEQSLRGLEFMGLAPTVFIGDPQRTAQGLAATIRNRTGYLRLKAQLQQRWQRFIIERRGKLLEVLGEV